MTPRFRGTLLFLSGLLGLPIAAAAQQTVSQRPSLRVLAVSARIKVDGVLDEPEWTAADSVEDLTQVEPREGGTPSGRTVVRVLALPDALVIGIRADDPEPERITAFTRQRDALLTSEDHIRLVLDTYLDGRSGYVFIVNPRGARYEALITNQGEGENSNWDAVWEAEAPRTPTGWSLEIRLPAKSLLFKEGLTTWGFNVERRVQRFLETVRWASPNQDTKINMTSRAGLLTELPAFHLGLGLSVRPAATGEIGREGPGGCRERSSGHWRPGPGKLIRSRPMPPWESSVSAATCCENPPWASSAQSAIRLLARAAG